MTTTMFETTYDTRELDSPVGLLTLAASEAGLRAILWPGDDLGRAGLVGATLVPGRSGILDEASGQLGEYFVGDRTSFDLPLDLQGTRFQVAAWEALATIPYGETRTYAEQAARIGRPSATRAIGAANGRNPVSIVLPCHRVVGSDGSLTGFASGLGAKAALLDLEAARAGIPARSRPDAPTRGQVTAGRDRSPQGGTGPAGRDRSRPYESGLIRG